MHPKTAARRAALRALTALENPETNLAQAMAAHFPGAPEGTRPFARELTSGTLRQRNLLDWTLAPLLKKPLEKLDAPVRAALRLGCYERTVLGTPAAVAGNEYAHLLRKEKLSSAAALFTAILRRLPDEPRPAPDAAADAALHLSVQYSHPLWLAKRWLARFGFEECAALMAANNLIAPLSLRVNTLRAAREGVLGSLVARGLKARASLLSPHAILVDEAGDPTAWPEWAEGKIIAQDEGAQLIAPLACAGPGQTVIDACAAPGGKTTHLAALMENQGELIACDLPGRLKLVRENAERLAITCLKWEEGDFRTLASTLPVAHAVLLDAPCTGTGTWRRRPDSRWKRTPVQLEELVALQSEMLNIASSAVRPGGILVYSTCSIESEENQDQIQHFLQRNTGWTLEETVQTMPHTQGCDGAFGARLRKEH